MIDFTQRFASKIPGSCSAMTAGSPFLRITRSSPTSGFFRTRVILSGGNSLSPFFSGLQPGTYNGTALPPGSADPYAIYITGREEIPPTTGYGPNGVASRPDTFPQLVSLDVPTDPNDAPYRTVGPTSGSQGAGQWTLTPTPPAFTWSACRRRTATRWCGRTTVPTAATCRPIPAARKNGSKSRRS